METIIIIALLLIAAYFLYTKVIRPRMNPPSPTSFRDQPPHDRNQF